MKPQIELSIKILSDTIATGKLNEYENKGLFLVMGLLQGMLILETVRG